jgi:hypothetical protein
MTFAEAKKNRDFWGQLVESAVGAALANGIKGENTELYYWSHRNREVDFVLRRGRSLAAIEVKSGRARSGLPGVEAFSKEFRVKRKLLVGGDGIPLDEFLLTDVTEWVK